MIKINKDFLLDGPIKPSIVAEIIQSASEQEVGAHSIFIGQVRADNIENKNVTGIEYTAYKEMLEPEMQKIIYIVVKKYDDLKQIHILHSTGLVKTGEISLMVFVACGHRKQSFKAVEEIVELIKEKIPVWKKEIFEDKTHQWPHNKKD
jgi:molybdopterin synthase catalytic subunit